MPGRLLNGQQQKDPKHKVKADEHRPNVVIPIKPSGTPQSIEQDVTPKGIKQAHQDQDDLQSALTLHTALLFGKTNFRMYRTHGGSDSPTYEVAIQGRPNRGRTTGQGRTGAGGRLSRLSGPCRPTGPPR